MAFLDNVRFIPTAAGTADWTYLSVLTGGYQSPSAAGAVSGARYTVFALSSDGSGQWELSQGIYNSSTLTFARTTVLYNSNGTGTASGQSGAGTKINFASSPTISLVAIAEDLNSLAGSFAQFEFTATAGQTAFSGTDANGATLSYTVGFLLVFVNGWKINKADFTATDGVTITIGQALNAGDQVVMVAHGQFNVANALLSTNNLSDVVNIAQAIANLGVVGYAAAQALSSAQQLQARQNIGAAAKAWTIAVLDTSNSAWPVPTGTTEMEIEAWGGGGSGAGQTGGAQRGAGGAGGSYGYKYTTGTMDSTLNITIGAGGSSVSASAGNNGGATTIVGTNLGTLTAGGGNGPSGAGFSSSGGQSTGCSGPWTTTITGGDGTTAGPTTSPASGAYGLGGDAPRGGPGGKSNVGAGGQIPGGGGSGENNTGGGSGAGAHGRVIIRTR
jgi:hypothetical protein